ncbi:MAG: hypothetical protein AAFW98_12260 [Pseudomonadota bacterium]
MATTTDRTVLAVLLAVASVAFSLALACGAPFAGLAAVAAIALGGGAAFGATILAFAANQAVGFGVLGYPVTSDSVAWGVVLGVSAILAAGAALGAARIADGIVGRAVLAFIAAFLVQQGTVFAATAVLPSHPDAFAQSVVLSILVTNLLAAAIFAVVAGLMVALRVGRLAGAGATSRT